MSWSRSQELLRQAVILAATLWLVVLIEFLGQWSTGFISGKRKGTDFVHFYTLAKVSASGNYKPLVSFREGHAAQTDAVPGSEFELYPPVYPPHVGLALAPLARFSYLGAYAVWTGVTMLLVCLSVWVMWRGADGLQAFRGHAVALTVGFPPLMYLVTHGQLAGFGLATLALGSVLMSSGRKMAAGAALGLLAYKWSLLCPALAILGVAGEAGMVLSALGVAAGAVLASVLVVGFDIVRAHFALMIDLLGAPDVVASKPFLMHSLRSFWAMLLPPTLASFCYFASAVPVLAVCRRGWWRARSSLERIAVLAVGIVTISPHVYVYDLVLLAPAFIVSAERVIASTSDSRWLTWVCYAAFLVTLLGPLCQLLHCQLSTPILVCWLLVLSRRPRETMAARRDACAPVG